tara:strand:- start:5675 stop:6277 length:603 start_codon:yes stop_codon:yes gene_type:complete
MTLLLLIIFVLNNCTTPPKIIPQVDLFIISDFSKYAEKDFLFTPLEYNGDYESIGLITKVFYPQATFIENNESNQKEQNRIVYKIKDTNEVYEGYVTYMDDSYINIKVDGFIKTYKLEDLLIQVDEKKYLPTNFWFMDEISSSYLIDSIYEECISMGANAFTMLKTKTVEQSYHYPPQNPFTVTGIEISGFAIKRKGAFK